MLPESIPTVTVTGRYLAPDGRPLSGQIVWRAPALLTFPAADVMLSGPVTAPLDANGEFAVTLPATDAPGMDPTGWAYVVTEQLTGVPSNRSYSVLLPAAEPAVDLADKAPTDPTTPNYVPIEGDSAYEVAVAAGFAGTVTQWLDSLVGPVGPKGDTGAQGVPGDDAYEVALAGGFVGDRAAWLASLVGPRGEQGVAGEQGAPGVVQSVNGQAVAAVVLDAADVNAVPDTAPGAPNGVAQLDATGKVPAAQLPASSGGGGVASVNGEAGPDVVLDAADVGALPASGLVAGGNLQLDSPTVDYRGFSFTTGGVNRWVYQVDNGAESGADAGSNFELANWSDAGQWKSSVLFGDRATGNLGIGTGALAASAKLTVAGPTALKDTTAPAAATGAAVAYSEGGVFKVVQANGTRVTLVDAVPTSAKGAANGVATLDASSRLPIAQLPTVTGRNMWTPQALGFQAWSVDPAAVANPTTLKAAVVGRLYLCGINITESTQVNRVVIMARGWAGSTAVPAARFFGGIYSEAGSRIAWTGGTALSNVPAAGQISGSAPGMTGNHIGAVPLPLTATATLAPGRYWAAFLLSAGSATDFYYMHIQNEAPSNPGNFFLGTTAFQRHWCIASGQTTLPATINQATGEVGLDPAIMALAMV